MVLWTSLAVGCVEAGWARGEIQDNYLIVPLVDLAMGVDAEDGRVGCVDEGLQLLCNGWSLLTDHGGTDTVT